MTFSEKLYQLRKNKGLSQEQLAEQLAVSRQAISKWESGTAMPESEKFLAISRFFQVSLDYLMKEEEHEEAISRINENATKEDELCVQTDKSATNLLGCIICMAGIIGLLIWGMITIFNPEASSQISTSSAIYIDGNGIFLILCVITIALGAGFLLKKSGNGVKNEKIK